MTKRVRVSAKSIKNAATGSDPGDDLEFYGKLWAVPMENVDGYFRPVGGHLHFLDVPSSEKISLKEGATYNIRPGSLVIVIQPGQFLRLYGELIETDTGPDDYMRPVPPTGLTIPYEAIKSGDWVVYFKEGNQRLEATWHLELA